MNVLKLNLHHRSYDDVLYIASIVVVEIKRF